MTHQALYKCMLHTYWHLYIYSIYIYANMAIVPLGISLPQELLKSLAKNRKVA